MKLKKIIPLFATALLFTACSNGAVEKPFAPGTQPAANIYAFQAATSIGLVGNIAAQPKLAPMMAQEGADTQSIADEIIKYLPSVEAALSGMDTLTSAKEETSDREGYAHKMTISYKDIALKDNDFIMYYNESAITDEPETDDKTTTEVAPETDNDVTTDVTTEVAPEGNTEVLAAKDVDEEDEEDQEIETEIKGIIVTGGAEYEMTGKREFDPEDNELETSFKYYIDEQTWVSVEQEIENDEVSFAYAIQEPDKPLFEYEIEIENNEEVELEIKNGEENETCFEFELEEKDGKQLIKAEYESNKVKETLYFEKVVDEETNTVSYLLVE